MRNKMENKTIEKTQIKDIIAKFEKADKIMRNTLFITIIIQAIASIALSYYLSVMSIFGIFTTIIISLELIIFFVWFAKRGHLHILKLNKLIEQAYGKIDDKDKEIAQQLLRESQDIMGDIEQLLKRGRIYRFFAVLQLKGEIKVALEGISYGIRLDALEAQSLLARLDKYFDSDAFIATKKQAASKLLADMDNLFASASYTLN